MVHYESLTDRSCCPGTLHPDVGLWERPLSRSPHSHWPHGLWRALRFPWSARSGHSYPHCSRRLGVRGYSKTTSDHYRRYHWRHSGGLDLLLARREVWTGFAEYMAVPHSPRATCTRHSLFRALWWKQRLHRSIFRPFACCCSLGCRSDAYATTARLRGECLVCIDLGAHARASG